MNKGQKMFFFIFLSRIVLHNFFYPNAGTGCQKRTGATTIELKLKIQLYEN